MHTTPTLRSRLGSALGTAAVALLASTAAYGDYPSTVLGDQPLAYYRLNDTAGGGSVNRNAGSLGAPGNATNLNVHLVGGAIAGRRNAATYFDSSARTIIPWNAALNPDDTKDFTIEAWFYPTSDKVSGSFVGPAPIMNRYSGSVANRQGWVYFQRGPNETYSGTSGIGWNFRTYTGVGTHVGVSITSEVPYKLGEWQHVVTVWDGAAQTATMYINGVMAATGGNTSADPKAYTANTDDHGAEQVNGPAGLAIGSYNNTELGANPFRGAIDEVAFYAKKLTAAQILAHYQNATNAARVTPYETLVQSESPVGYWRLDDPVAGPNIAVNMGLAQNAGSGTNTVEVRQAATGALPATTDGAYAFHWRNGTSTTEIPWTAGNNPEATQPFTIEAWFRPTSDRISPGASPINNRLSSGAANRTGWVFFQRAPNDTYSGLSGYEGVGWNFRMYHGSGGASSDVVSGVPYTVGEWQHVVATWDGSSTATLYVNGVEAASNAGVTYTANANPPLSPDDLLAPAGLAVGSYNRASGFGSNPFEGDMDEVALYNVQLTADQILAHYQTGTNAHPAESYATLVLSAPYDQLGTQALQPATYLRFSEPAPYAATNSGTLGDAAEGNRMLADAQAPGPQPPAYPGFDVSNLAVPLDGLKSWVSLNNPAGLNLSGQLTLEAWIKPAASQGTVARILSHGTPTLSSYTAEQVETNGSVVVGPEVFLRLEGNGANYVVGSSDGTNTHGASFAVPAGDLGSAQWIYLVGTYDGAQWRLFRNGAEVASNPDAVGALPVDDGGWAIGSIGNGWADNFAGAIDEAAIYARALTPAQVSAHYFAGVPAPQIAIATAAGGKVTLTWPAGVLQESVQVTGTYADVPGNPPSGYTIAPGGAAKFYRLRL